MANTNKDDTAIRELLAQPRIPAVTKVRIVVQSRKPQRAKDGVVKDTSYSQLPGHVRIVEVRTVREFRRLWKGIEQFIDGRGWQDGGADSELPDADRPVAAARQA